MADTATTTPNYAALLTSAASIYAAASAANAQITAANAQARLSGGQLALAREVFANITKPQFIRASAYLWGYGAVWGTNIIEKVVNCGTSICEYVGDGGTVNRVIATSVVAMNRARRGNMRTLRRGQIGIHYDNEFRASALQATLTMKAIGIAEQFDNDKALKWGQFYWARNLNASQFAQNTIAVGANIINGASSGIQGALNGMAGLTGTTLSSTQLTIAAAQSQQSFVSGIGALAGLILGKQDGSVAGNTSGLIASLGKLAGPDVGGSGSSPAYVVDSVGP